MTQRSFIIISYIFCIFCIGKNTFAQSYYHGMGDAGYSMVAPVEAATLNPALLSYMKSNHFHLFHDTEDRNADGLNQSWQTLGVSIVDTQTSKLFPGSLSFLQSEEDNTNAEKRLYKLAIGRKEFSQFAFGLSFNRLEYSSPVVEKTEHDVTLGITYSPMELWGVSFVVENATNGDYLGTKYVLATHYIYDPFMKLNLDVSRKDRQANSNLSYNFGLALPIADFDITLGYKSEAETSLEFFTGGLVWRGPRLGLSYAYHDLIGDGEGDGHFIDIGFFF